jgi:hypothetical protein
MLALGLGRCGAQLSCVSGEAGVDRDEAVVALALTDLGREVDDSGEGHNGTCIES